MRNDLPLKSVNPTTRHGIIGGRNLLELIRSVIANSAGEDIAEIIHVDGILDCLLEEYFFGGTLQDEFRSQLTEYKVPTDIVNFIRKSIIQSICIQMRCVFGEIIPCNHYTYSRLPDGDIMVSEQTPRLPFLDRKQVS